MNMTQAPIRTLMLRGDGSLHSRQDPRLVASRPNDAKITYTIEYTAAKADSACPCGSF